MTFGEKLQSLRQRAGMSQDALAERVGLEPKSLSAIERGVVGASLSTLKAICVSLHVSSDALLFGTGGENDPRALTAMLSRLTLRQFAIAEDMLKKLLEAFETKEV